MIKMAVFDLDGTLLNSDSQISEANLTAINDLRQAGIRVAVATGRSEPLVKPYIDILQMNDPIIMNNGSVIGHPFHDIDLLELVVPKQSIKDIVEYCYRHHYTVMAYSRKCIFCKPEYRVHFFKSHSKNMPGLDNLVFKGFDDYEAIVDQFDINKVLVIENNLKTYEKIQKDLSIYTDCEFVRSGVGYLDINPRGATKGSALEILSKHYGILPEEIIAFGDQNNDVTMLQYAGIGVAMGNATDAAKAAADFITLTNDEDGVAYGVRKYILKS